MITATRAFLLSCLAAGAVGADVLNLDDGEKAGTWQARHDGKLALCDVRSTFNTSKVGDGCILTAFKKQKGGWCSLGRPINADWTAFACLRFWIKAVGVAKDFEVRLTDTGNENFVTRVTVKTPGEWEYVALPFASFQRNAGYQAQGAATDGKLDLIKITDLNISPLGEGEGRFWLDQVDLAIIPEALPLSTPPMPPAPARLFELDAPLVKKSTKVDIDAGHITGRLSQHLAGGWGEDVGEFADNTPWADLVRAAGLPLLRINARVDRHTRDGVYDTWLLEQDIKALGAAGSQAYVVIDGIPAGMAKGSRDNPTDANAYADVVAAIVQKINVDQKLGVRFWQFWQDADLKDRWTGSAEDFGVLASRVIERMKRVDPTITVFSGGLSRSTAVRAVGQQSATLDPAVDGLAWSTFAFEKIADGNATEALERTWGFERTFLHAADISRAVARPLTASVALRVAAERTVYNPRLDSIFAPVYLASSINHFARQNAAVGLWQNATPQLIAGLLDPKGKHRPLVSFMGRWNAIVRERPWYLIAADTGTAMVESLAAVSGDRFVILLVNKDSTGGQHELTLKYVDMKIATANVWTLGRGVEAGEDKPLSGGGTRLVLPPTSVTLISGTLAEPLADPAKEFDVAGGGKTQVTVRHVDRASRTLFADDKEGRAFVIAVGDTKPVPAKKPAKDETPVERPFLPGQQLEVTGRKKAPFIIAEKSVLQGETASVPTTSDSGFNLAERIKGKPVVVAERLKPGFDAGRLAEMSGKPTIGFQAKQIQGIKGMPPQDSDFSAKIRLAWNEEDLIVVVTVLDETVMAGDPPTRWDRQDSVVLGFDMGLDSTAGSNDENDTQIVAYAKDKKGQAFTPIALGKKGGTFGGLKYTRPNNESSVFIFSIPWHTLGFVPETGRRFGFNLVITESDKEKSAEGFFEWAAGMSNVNLNAQDFGQFGILELK